MDLTSVKQTSLKAGAKVPALACVVEGGMAMPTLLDPRDVERLRAAPRPLAGQLPRDFARLWPLLAEQDRRLVELALRDGLTHRQIAALYGKAPGTITRRLRRITNNLRDPIVSVLADPLCTLSTEHRAIGIARFLHRRSVRELAIQFSLSQRQTLDAIHYVKGWFDSVRARR